jgi:hypothetical protein
LSIVQLNGIVQVTRDPPGRAGTFALQCCRKVRNCNIIAAHAEGGALIPISTSRHQTSASRLLRGIPSCTMSHLIFTVHGCLINLVHVSISVIDYIAIMLKQLYKVCFFLKTKKVDFTI